MDMDTESRDPNLPGASPIDDEAAVRCILALRGEEGAAPLDPERCYRLLEARDARFDGRLFVGVRSTGVFCRPICPAPTPKARNCTFWRSAAAAQAAGFRPCLRCRPEAAPGTPAWRGTEATVSRALRLIEAGALDGEGSVERLADRLGVGDRHLRRLFDRHLGTTPVAVAKLRRVLFAKQLLTETDLPMTEVALASGFGSQRRFNACLREVYDRPPSELRRRRRAGAGRGRAKSRGASPTASAHRLELTLPFRPPLAWTALLRFLGLRAIPGVERVDGDVHARTVRTPSGVALVRSRLGERGDRLHVDVRTERTDGLIELTTQLRRLFDLDADSVAVDALLAGQSRLRAHVERAPGIRVPGTVDGFETVVRAILGQQVSVKGATTLAARIVERWGAPLPETLADDAADFAGLTALFPLPDRLVDAPLESIGLPGARAEAIRTVARAVVAEPAMLAPASALEAGTEAWEALRGIGPWTAHYIAMRVLREPDALPTGDLGLRKALTAKAKREAGLVPAREVEKRLEGCRPYRAYAAMRLWDTLGD